MNILMCEGAYMLETKPGILSDREPELRPNLGWDQCPTLRCSSGVLRRVRLGSRRERANLGQVALGRENSTQNNKHPNGQDHV